MARPLCLSQPLSPDTLLSLLSPASLPPVSSLLSPPFSSLLSLLFYGVWIHSSDIDCGWILTPREHFQSTSDPPLRRWPPTPASIESRLSSVLNSATRAPPPPASDHIVPRKRARPEQQLSETFWGRRKFTRRARGKANAVYRRYARESFSISPSELAKPSPVADCLSGQINPPLTRRLSLSQNACPAR